MVSFNNGVGDILDIIPRKLIDPCSALNQTALDIRPTNCNKLNPRIIDTRLHVSHLS